MKKKMINTEHIEGRVYDHSLAIKTVQNQQSENYGKEFISGNLDVAVDDAGLNVLTIHFTYVTEKTSKGNTNATFTNLKQIINEGKTVLKVGQDATMVSIDTALALNDFYDREDKLVSAKRNEGGFVTIVNKLKDESERNTFTTDMVITSINRVEANEEKYIDEHVAVRGAVFNFRNEILPVEFTVKNPKGMEYFENLTIEPSAPIFTKVWGRINGTTISIPRVEESAFGEAAVHNYERKVREWLITGTSAEPYDFGGEDLTAEELTKAMQDREVYLADVKKRNDEYKASRAASTPAPAVGGAPASAVPAGNFSF